MTYDVSCTSLWRKAFIENRKDCSAAEQAFFRQNLENMRERVKPLVARIMRDMPGYTVPNMTHLDALWETASLVATDDLALNLPEAFVFGGAVLLHDAGMTVAAYPGGLAEIKTTPEWADAMALSADRSNVGCSTATPEIKLRRRLLSTCCGACMLAKHRCWPFRAGLYPEAGRTARSKRVSTGSTD